MVPFAAVGAFCLLLFESSHAWFWPFKSEDPVVFEHEHVTKLTKDTFEDHILKEDGRFYFAKFYAPWCGHCKTLAPTWGQVAAENENPDLEFVQVDCAANRALCDKAAVRGFPEFKVFYNGRIGLAMRGGKDLAGMRSFVQEALPTVRENHKKALDLESNDKDVKPIVEKGGSTSKEL